MELGALVAEALLTGAELLEVLGSLGDDVVVELEVDAALAGWWNVLATALQHQVKTMVSNLRLSLMSLEDLSTLPLASVLRSGPCQVQSKKQLTTMLADEAWKERLKVG